MALGARAVLITFLITLFMFLRGSVCVLSNAGVFSRQETPMPKLPQVAEYNVVFCLRL